jgi:toxin ParE1/3/4
MTYRIVVEGEAEKELNEARNWYNARKPGLGQRLAREIRRLLREVAQNPERYRKASRLTRVVRLWGWQYLIYFTFQKEPPLLIVAAIFHAKRDPAELKRRLL